MANVQVRKAAARDLESVLDIRVAHGSRAPGPPTSLELTTWERMMGTRDLSVYVAESDKHVVGSATTMTMPNVNYGCAPTLFIEAVLVHPAYRRRGCASQLLTTILEDARQQGCDKVQLLSHKRHAADGAHALYERNGFTAEAEGFRAYLRSGTH